MLSNNVFQSHLQENNEVRKANRSRQNEGRNEKKEIMGFKDNPTNVVLYKAI